MKKLTLSDYQALAEFRYQIRRFLHFSEEVVKQAGLERGQYQLMLAIKGMADGVRPRIRELATRMQIRHHSAVELVNRLEARGFVHRTRARDDRREVLLALTPKGEKVLGELALHHHDQLRSAAPELITALRRVMREGKDAAPQSTSREKRNFKRFMNDLSASAPSRNSFQAPDSPAPFRMLLVCLLSAAIGLVAGIVAFVLYKLIGLFTNLFFYHRWSTEFSSAQHNHLGWMVIVTPVIGGLIVGVMAKYGTSKIKGHGIPEAMEAVLFNRSRIAPRVAILKPISAAIAIGTGGPFGAEGPIIQTGGAIGSLVGQAFHTTAVERKVLLACGAAAGMSATFNTPIAGVILAIELLLFEFKSRSFIPLVIASTLATAVHMQLLGIGPMFTVSAMDFAIPRALPFYLVLGLICGLAAVGFSKLLYWVEDQFEKLPFDDLWWPAIGALGLGIIGFFVPRVLGVGYDTIGDILNGQLAWKILLVVMLAKAVALAVSLGSGTSGGLLAPCFMWSAAMGGIFAMVANYFVPGAHLSPGAFALVAMGAVFAAASRATFTFIIFAFEITRDYNSVLPLMLVSVIADGIAMLLMPNSSIMTEKLARRGLLRSSGLRS